MTNRWIGPLAIASVSVAMDIAYFNGPLSPYLNSLWFRLFGVSLRTLVICNLAILTGVLCLLYRILASLQAHPPDDIVLAHRDASEYGARFFGRDDGQRLYGWARQHYRDVRLLGAPPLQDNRFGILLLKRLDNEARH